MNRSFRQLLWLLVAACGQGRDVEPTTPTIAVSLERTVHSLTDSLDLAEKVPAVSGRGFVVTHTFDGASGGLALFDSSGQFVSRIGRSGSGPGEFRRADAIGFGANDSLWVLDWNVTVHVFSPPPTMQYARTFQLSRRSTGPIGRYGVYSAGFWTPEGVRGPHLLGPEGELVADYGLGKPTLHPTDGTGALAPISRDQIWSANSGIYALERLSSDGQVHQRIERDVPWFPLSGTPRRSMYERPRPAIRALYADVNGIVWVLIRRPSANWKPPSLSSPVPPGTGIPLAALRSPGTLEENYEGVLEALDGGSGRLLASRVVSGGASGFVEGGLLVEIQQDDTGRVTLRFFRMAVERGVVHRPPS